MSSTSWRAARSVLVVAEVRTRASNAYGGAAASVTPAKQRRIVRAASQLLQQRRELARLPVRFDVIVVSDPDSAQPRIEWIRHAFEASLRVFHSPEFVRNCIRFPGQAADC